jgi:hypothetical protein
VDTNTIASIHSNVSYSGTQPGGVDNVLQNIPRSLRAARQWKPEDEGASVDRWDPFRYKHAFSSG